MYIVLGRGIDTLIYDITINNLDSEKIDNRSLYYIEYTNEGKKYEIWLQDVSIGKYHYPNMNYVFSIRDDAEEYAEWAEENTITTNIFDAFKFWA